MSSTTIEKNTVEPPIGAKVRHEKFGTGEVMDVGNGHATVLFGDETARVRRNGWNGKASWRDP